MAKPPAAVTWLFVIHLEKESEMHFSMKKKVAAVATVLALAGGATAAFAYWTTSGAGSGTATTGTNTALTIDQNTLELGADSGLVLSVGGANALPVGFTIHNSASSPQQVSGVTFSISSIVPALLDSSKPACTVADFALTQPTWTPVEIPATGATSFDATGAKLELVDNASANQDNCKNVTVNLAFLSS